MTTPSSLSPDSLAIGPEPMLTMLCEWAWMGIMVLVVIPRPVWVVINDSLSKSAQACWTKGQEHVPASQVVGAPPPWLFKQQWCCHHHSSSTVLHPSSSSRIPSSLLRFCIVETHPSPSTPPSSKQCGQLATASDNSVILWVLVVVVMVVVMVVVVMVVLVVIVVIRVGHWLTKLKRSATEPWMRGWMTTGKGGKGRTMIHVHHECCMEGYAGGRSCQLQYKD